MGTRRYRFFFFALGGLAGRFVALPFLTAFPFAGPGRRVLARGLDGRGVSFNSFVDARGRPGNGKGGLAVYGKKGQPCGVCQRVLKTVKVAGRGAA